MVWRPAPTPETETKNEKPTKETFSKDETILDNDAFHTGASALFSPWHTSIACQATGMKHMANIYPPLSPKSNTRARPLVVHVTAVFRGRPVAVVRVRALPFRLHSSRRVLGRGCLLPGGRRLLLQMAPVRMQFEGKLRDNPTTKPEGIAVLSGTRTRDSTPKKGAKMVAACRVACYTYRQTPGIPHAHRRRI